jgi:hypothetical protein
MAEDDSPSPSIIAHCDWSTSAKKRWMAWAKLGCNGEYEVQGLQQVECSGDLIPWLRERAVDNTAILLGFDFPIGLPEVYAVHDMGSGFLELLPLLGVAAPWKKFYEVGDSPQDISAHRPFYPKVAKGSKQRHLYGGLGADTFDGIRRRCERGYQGRRPACPLFWLVGAAHVGDAAINGWAEVISPALRETGKPTAVWPFSGELVSLLRPNAVVIAETYPTEYYRQLGVKFGAGIGSKRSQDARSANAAALLASAEALRLSLPCGLKDTIRSGFASGMGADDGFDALVGLMGMLKVVRGELPSEAPNDDTIRRVEGWILGQAPISELREPTVPE